MKKFLLVVFGLFVAFMAFGVYIDRTTPEAEKQARRERLKSEREAEAQAAATVTAEVKTRLKQAVDETDEIGAVPYRWERHNDVLIVTLEIPESDA